MQKKRSKIAFLREVKITRESDYAYVELIDPGYANHRIYFGSDKLASMTDEDILKVYNAIILSQKRLLAESRPTEIAEGSHQIKYDAEYKHWVPQSHVLRCELTSGDQFDELVVCIDNEELSWDDFGKMLKVYMGWGMRVMFLPQEQLVNPPPVQIQKNTKKG